MPKQTYTSFNRYFLIPYFLWIGSGCLLFLLIPDKRTLFELINTHHDNFFDFILYYTTWLGNGVVITAILTLLLVFKRFRTWWYAATALTCNLLPALCGQLLKHHIEAPRPISYFHEAGWIHIASGWPILLSNSFPSGHTTGAFSLFCFLSMLLPKKSRWIGIPFFLLALAVAYSRIYLAAHFFEDVFAGSIIGAVLTLCLFYVMRIQEYKFPSMAK